MTKKISHIDEKGNAIIVDVSKKIKTKRYARARASVCMPEKIIKLIKENKLEKGNVFNVARVAAIMGAKQTSSLIPLCHNITLDSCNVDFLFLKEELQIESSVVCEDKTGVEMEALTAVSIGALTVYDMLKGLDKSIYIKNIHLLEKKGGKSGDFKNKIFLK